MTLEEAKQELMLNLAFGEMNGTNYVNDAFVLQLLDKIFSEFDGELDELQQDYDEFIDEVM